MKKRVFDSSYPNNKAGGFGDTDCSEINEVYAGPDSFENSDCDNADSSAAATDSVEDSCDCEEKYNRIRSGYFTPIMCVYAGPDYFRNKDREAVGEYVSDEGKITKATDVIEVSDGNVCPECGCDKVSGIFCPECGALVKKDK